LQAVTVRNRLAALMETPASARMGEVDFPDVIVCDGVSHFEDFGDLRVATIPQDGLCVLCDGRGWTRFEMCFPVKVSISLYKRLQRCSDEKDD
jgi:hypothetical protein